MARLLVVHDDRADVQVEITIPDEGPPVGRCTCGQGMRGEGSYPYSLHDLVTGAGEHVDQTHGSRR